MNDGLFIGLILLALGVVTTALSWPVTVRCCYCEEAFAEKSTLGERLFSGFSSKCHKQCFWDTHPIPPPPPWWPGFRTRQTEPPPPPMPHIVEPQPSVAELIDAARTLPPIGDPDAQ